MANVLNQTGINSFASYIGITDQDLTDDDKDLISDGGVFTHTTKNKVYAKNTNGVFEIGNENAYSKDEADVEFATNANLTTNYAKKFVSDVAPEDKSIGDLWIDTSDNDKISMAKNVNGSVEWVEV